MEDFIILVNFFQVYLTVLALKDICEIRQHSQLAKCLALKTHFVILSIKLFALSLIFTAEISILDVKMVIFIPYFRIDMKIIYFTWVFTSNVLRIDFIAQS